MWLSDYLDLIRLVCNNSNVFIHPEVRTNNSDPFIREGKHFHHFEIVPPIPLSYTDQNLYFQIYNKEDIILSGTNDILNIPNYRESLFEVLPTSSFEIND